ncbi:monocarboxylate transporter 10-like [Pelodiscus sinensis]|uniref:monocarboxylate transporter 10-like n=1 Tax=Pelodiscus sinensis TaxID=13735 RepID=UPI003F6B4C61
MIKKDRIRSVLHHAMHRLEKDNKRGNLQKESSFFYPPPDGGWGWVVVLAACTHALLVSGFHNAFGVYMISLLETFQSSRSRTAWIGSVSYGFIMIFGPVSGKLLQKYGAIKVAVLGALVVMLGVICSSFAGDIRVLFLTHGILVGVGSSFASTPGLIMVSLYFTTKRSFATGIVMAGGAAGTLVQNQVHRYLIKAFGWRTSLRVYCGILTLCIFAGFAYRPLEKRRHPSVVENFQTSPLKGFIVDLSLWKDSIFELWVCALGLAKFGFFIPFVHMMTLAGDLGISLDDASYIMVGIGISSLLSCLLFGKICDLENINRLYINQASVLSVGLLYLTVPLCTTFPSLIAFGTLLGFFDAGNYVLLPVLTLDLMGAEKMPVAWGFMMAVHTISSFGPPFAGWIYDLLGSYNLGFVVPGLCSLAAAGILAFIPRLKNTSVQQKKNIIHASVCEVTNSIIPWESPLPSSQSLSDSYAKYSSVWTSIADLPKVEYTPISSPTESTTEVEIPLEEGEASDSKKEAYVAFVDVEQCKDEDLHDEGTAKTEVPPEEDEFSGSKKPAHVAFINVEQYEDKDLLGEDTGKLPFEEGEVSGSKKAAYVTFVDGEQHKDEVLCDEDREKVEVVSLEKDETSGSKKETHVTFVDVEDEDPHVEGTAQIEEPFEEDEASGSKKAAHVSFVDGEQHKDEVLRDEDREKVEVVSLEKDETSGSKKETHVTFVDVEDEDPHVEGTAQIEEPFEEDEALDSKKAARVSFVDAEQHKDEGPYEEGRAKVEEVVPLEKGETSGSKKETHVTFKDVEDEDLHDESTAQTEKLFEEDETSDSKKGARVSFVDAEQRRDEGLNDDDDDDDEEK